MHGIRISVVENRLEKRLPSGEREAAFSYMSRLAASHHNNVSDFGIDMEISFPKVTKGSTVEIERLAILGGIDADDLTAWTPHFEGRGVHWFRGEVFHPKGIKETTIRGCPVCLRDDAAESMAPPHEAMQIRGHWLPRHVVLCLKHLHPLVPLWTQSQESNRYDTVSNFKSVAPAVLSGSLDRPVRESRPFDHWIEARLTKGRSEGWLDGFGLHAAAHFCELLGRAVQAIKIPKWMKLHEEDRWLSYSIGYDLASQGEDHVRQVLTELQEIIGTAHDGPKKKFGDLYDRLARDLTSEDYAPFRDLLRSHIAETWPMGPGDELMGEPVQVRRKHSVLTAAREIGMDPRRLRKLLVEAGFVRSADEGREDAWELFDARSAEEFLYSLNRHVSALDLQNALQISRSQFELLRADGIFEPDIAGEDHKPLWDLAKARAYLDGLLVGAEAIYVPMHQWHDLPKASQRLRIMPGQILRMIETRQITRIGRHLSRDGYAAILIDLAEVERCLQRPRAKGMSIETFAKSVGLKPSPANTMVRNGFIPSTIGQNPKTHADQRYLTAEDIAEYHKTFTTLRNLALLLGQSWQSLTFRLKDANIAEFSPDGRDFGAVFAWRDIELTLLCRWPRQQH